MYFLGWKFCCFTNQEKINHNRGMNGNDLIDLWFAFFWGLSFVQIFRNSLECNQFVVAAVGCVGVFSKHVSQNFWQRNARVNKRKQKKKKRRAEVSYLRHRAITCDVVAFWRCHDLYVPSAKLLLFPLKLYSIPPFVTQFFPPLQVEFNVQTQSA